MIENRKKENRLFRHLIQLAVSLLTGLCLALNFLNRAFDYWELIFRYKVLYAVIFSLAFGGIVYYLVFRLSLNSLNRYRPLTIALWLLLALVSALLIRSNLFLETPLPPRLYQLTINATRQQNPASHGSEVWLLEARDEKNRLIPVYDFSSTGVWETRQQPRQALVSDQVKPASLYYETRDRPDAAKEILLLFLSHPNGGMVTVQFSGQQMQIDLFSPIEKETLIALQSQPDMTWGQAAFALDAVAIGLLLFLVSVWFVHAPPLPLKPLPQLAQILLVFAPVICTALAFRLIYLQLPLGYDEYVWAYTGWRISGGDFLPYRDVLDNKPPLVYLPFTVSEWLLGHGWENLRLTGIILSTANTLLLTAVVYALFGALPALTVGLAEAIFGTSPLLQGNYLLMSEQIVKPALIVALWLFYLYRKSTISENDPPPSRFLRLGAIFLFMSGLVIACASLIKQTYLLLLPLVVLLILFPSFNGLLMAKYRPKKKEESKNISSPSPGREAGGERIIQQLKKGDHCSTKVLSPQKTNLATFCVGFAAPWILILIIFGIHGALGDFFYCVFGHNLGAVLGIPSPGELWRETLAVLTLPHAILLLLAVALGFFAIRKTSQLSVILFIWALTVIGLFSILAGGNRLYSHYFLLGTFPIYLLGGAGLSVINAKIRRFAALAFWIILLIAIPGEWWSAVRNATRAFPDPAPRLEQYLAAHASPSDRYYFDGVSFKYYYETSQPAPTPFLGSVYLSDQERLSQQALLLDALRKQPPTWIVTGEGKLVENDPEFESFLRDNYRYEADWEHGAIYRQR